MASADPKVRKADQLFSLLVRERDQRCRRCDVPMAVADLATHHLIKRRYRKTRWMFENAVALDHLCHEYLEKHPFVNESFAISILGEDRWAELQGLARSTKTKVDLDEVIADLKGMAA